MHKPQILIVDDEPLARQRLRDLIADAGAFDVAGEAANGVEAMEILQDKHIHIVLLDIRMPGMDGIELAQHLHRLPDPPAIIFTTAYDHYAVQAFELNAMDYLLKPIRGERLVQALSKVKPLQSAQVQALQPLQATHAHLSIHERGRIVLVPVAEVLYFRAELKYVTVRTRTHSYLLETSLNQLEQEYGALFVRLHRNALVAKNAIAGFEKQRLAQGSDSHWVALIKDVAETIAVSRRHQHLIKSL